MLDFTIIRDEKKTDFALDGYEFYEKYKKCCIIMIRLYTNILIFQSSSLIYKEVLYYLEKTALDLLIQKIKQFTEEKSEQKSLIYFICSCHYHERPDSFLRP